MKQNAPLILIGLVCVSVVLLCAGRGSSQTQTPPKSWHGALLKPVEREEVYAFTERPEINKLGRDRYAITFAAKAKCDAAVAIEDSSGKIVKHIGYGVLGANAPKPFQKDSLKQTIIWNGKDDNGKYIDSMKGLRLRVSLGLKPTFDRIIGWHPKDINGRVCALGADEGGVYVAIGAGGFSTIRKFDHQGNYLRTVYPFPADKLDKLKGVELQPIEGQPLGVPKRNRFADITPYGAMGGRVCTSLAIHDGIISFLGHGDSNQKPIVRIATDGSTGGVSAAGPHLAAFRGQYGDLGEPAISPDGKWIYITRLMPTSGHQSTPFRPFKTGTTRRGVAQCRHAVFRIAWDSEKPINENQSFFGEGVKPGKDNLHLDNPESVATDAQGRVYVTDCNNDRIVVLSPEGKFLQAIPVKRPRRIAVHRKTGTIYVTAFDWEPENFSLIKISPLPNPRVLVRQDFPPIHYRSLQNGMIHKTVFCLDSWSDPVRIWFAEGPEVQIWEERGKGFKQIEDFTETVKRDGYRPHSLASGYRMVRVTADPIRGHLYYTNNNSPVLLRFDPNEGKKAVPIRVTGQGGSMVIPGSGTQRLGMGDDVQMGFDGLLYCRSVQYLARFDPSVLEPDGESGGYRLVKEIPFDYGETRSRGLEFPRAGVQLPAMIPGCGFSMGMCVAPNGNIMALCDNFQDARGMSRHKNWRTIYKADNESASKRLPQDRYRPPVFPGRLWSSAPLIFVWNNKGELIGEDVVPAIHSHSSGIRGDRDGNIYISLAAYQMVNGKPFGPLGGGNIGPGAVLKFPPTGGRIYGTWGSPVPLKKLPDRPHEFTTGRNKIYTKNMLWAVPGMSTLNIGSSCRCPQSRFDVDWYGRVFIPETWRFSVNVVDTNGNQITHIGRYGNADSGAGKPSPVPVPGGIAFSQSDYLCTVTDRWLYVSDSGNFRIVRIRLGYHVEEYVAMK